MPVTISPAQKKQWFMMSHELPQEYHPTPHHHSPTHGHTEQLQAFTAMLSA